MDEKQMARYAEEALLAGFIQARRIYGTCNKTKIHLQLWGTVDVYYNVGRYTKCMVGAIDHNSLWIGQIGQIKQLAARVVKLAIRKQYK